jgi:hypothetical protein
MGAAPAAVEHISNPSLFLLRLPQNYDFALVIVDFEARHVFEAPQEEFQIGNGQVVVLDKDESVVYIM